MKTKLIALLLILITTNGYAQSKIIRNELLNIDIDQRMISAIKVVEIEFQAGQKGPTHSHPCPVIGQINAGTCLIQIAGEPARILTVGDCFYEPASTPIIHFDNYSEAVPMKFIAYYLTNGEKELTEILPEENVK